MKGRRYLSIVLPDQEKDDVSASVLQVGESVIVVVVSFNDRGAEVSDEELYSVKLHAEDKEETK